VERKKLITGGAVMAAVMVLFLAIPAWRTASLGAPIFVFVETVVAVLLVFSLFWKGRRPSD
jgi:hypothetical protein